MNGTPQAHGLERFFGRVAGVVLVPLLDVTIPGNPIGKPRHRTGRGPDGRPRHYADKKGRGWETAAALLFREQWRSRAALAQPVGVYVCAVLKRPDVLKHDREAAGRILRDQKPDGDNVLKAVADALELGKILDNDKRIGAKAVESWWAAFGEGEHVRVVMGLPAGNVACRVHRPG